MSHHCKGCVAAECQGDVPWADVAQELATLRRERDRYRRAYERNRIVIDLLAKYPEEDEHGR